MSAWGRWWTRLSTILGSAVLALFVPVAAWASTGVGSVAVEAARRRPRVGGGFLAALCCFAVVALIVILVLLMMRRRRH